MKLIKKLKPTLTWRRRPNIYSVRRSACGPRGERYGPDIIFWNFLHFCKLTQDEKLSFLKKALTISSVCNMQSFETLWNKKNPFTFFFPKAFAITREMARNWSQICGNNEERPSASKNGAGVVARWLAPSIVEAETRYWGCTPPLTRNLLNHHE